ncbi:MAG: hypothetical protein FJ388_16075, partial [Verrucomicrobia bacterium]|nr:hypothetical protein [Verrucomicrobiota bacterium]
MKRFTIRFLLLTFCISVHAQTVVREWRPEDLAKWHRGLVKNARVADDALHFETEAGDSMLISPAFEGFPATPWQRVELVMKSDVSGPCDVFWSGTTKSKYGGFWPTKRTGFQSEAGDFRTYVIEPYWQAEKKIILLRLDFPHDKPGHYAIKSLRIVDTAPPTVTTLPARDVALDADGEWRARVSLRAEECPFVTVRMSASAGNAGVLSFVSAERDGMKTVSFPLRADGRMHTYNLDASSGSGWENWRGEIIALRLRPTETRGAQVKIESISAEADLTGPADLEVTYFALGDAFARAGRPVRLEAMVRNNGSETARGVKAKLKLSGARLLKEETAPAEIEYGMPATFAWTVRADSPGKAKARLEIGDLPPVTQTLEFKRPQNLPKAAYVPKPKPAKSDYQVGVYYFPGWH